MDVVILALFCAAVPAVVFGTANAVGYDWRKASDYGRSRAAPPPLWLLLVVSGVLALVVFMGWLISQPLGG